MISNRYTNSVFIPVCRQLLWALAAISVLASSACSGQAMPYSNQPTATSSVCLVGGIWAIRHPETFYIYSLPAGSFDISSLVFKSSAGGIAYRFDDKGVLTVEAVELTGNFSVKEGAALAPLEITINGFASGAYSINGDTVTLDKVLSGNINYAATYSGEQMMNTSKVEDFAPLFVPPYRTAKFVCAADKLTLQIVNFPGYQENIEFERMIK